MTPQLQKLGNSIYSGLKQWRLRLAAQLNIVLEDGSIISDQDTILDIRTGEFPTLPVQGDTINIPYDPIADLPTLGDFEIINVWNNGGGEITLQLRAIVP